MPVVTLTDLTVRMLKPVPGKRVTYLDKGLKGFGVRVTPTGQKSYVLVMGANRQRIKLGDVGLVKLADARDRAKDLLAQKQLGSHSTTSTPTYQSAVADFLASRKHCRPRTLKDYQRLLTRHGFGAEKLDDISPKDIHARLDRLPPSERLHAHDALQIFFRHAYRRHLIDRNPMERTERPEAGKRRERTLSDAELRAVWHACEGMFGQIVRLCILTGQRRSEIAQLTWEMVDQEAKIVTLPAQLTKNGRTHSFPYGEMAADLFRDIMKTTSSVFLFPARQWGQGKNATVYASWGRDKPKLDTRSGVAGWVLHDLRRTFSTNWASLGIRLEVTEKYINHISGSSAGVAGIYNRHSYGPRCGKR